MHPLPSRDPAQLHSAEQVTPPPQERGHKRLTAEEVLADLRAGGPLILQRCVITTRLSLAGMFVPDAVKFDRCRFEHELDATNARFGKTVTITRSLFRKSLTLRGAKIGGTLEVSRSVVKMPEPPAPDSKTLARTNRQSHLYEPPPDSRSAKWDALNVDGNLVLDRLTVFGSLNLGGGEIKGGVYLRGAQIGKLERVDEKVLDNGRLYMRQMRIDGDVDCTPAIREHWSHAKEEHPFRSWPMCVRSSFSIGSTVILGRLNIRGAEIRGCLHAIMAQISGRVLADGWYHPDKPERTWRTRIGVAKHFCLSAAHETCAKTAEDMLPDAQRELSNCAINADDEHGAEDDDSGRLDADTQRRLSIYFQDAKIGSSIWLRGIRTDGGLDFDNAEIGGSLDMRMWHVEKPPAQTDDGWKKIEADRKSSDRDQPWYQTDLGMSYHFESLCFRNFKLGANLHMEGIRADGRIVGHNAEIRGNIRCLPFRMRDVREYIIPNIGSNGDGKSLSLYGSKIGGNIEINGSHFKGAVRLRYVHVEGALIAQPFELGRGVNQDDTPTANSALNPKTIIGMSHKGHGLYLYGSTIAGNVCCTSLETEGCLSLKLAKIGGAVEFKDSKIAHASVSEFAAKMRSLPLFLEPGVSLESATVGGDAEFAGATVGLHFDATNLRLNGTLNLGRYTADKGASFKKTRIGPIDDAEMQKWLTEGWQLLVSKQNKIWDRLGLVNLNLARINGTVEAKRLKTSGRISAQGMSAAGFFLIDAAIGNPLLPKDEAVIIISESQFSGRFDLSGGTVLRALCPTVETMFRPLNFWESPTVPPRKGVVDLSHTHVGDFRHRRSNESTADEACPVTFELDGFHYNDLEIEPFFGIDRSSESKRKVLRFASVGDVFDALRSERWRRVRGWTLVSLVVLIAFLTVLLHLMIGFEPMEPFRAVRNASALLQATVTMLGNMALLVGQSFEPLVAFLSAFGNATGWFPSASHRLPTAFDFYRLAAMLVLAYFTFRGLRYYWKHRKVPFLKWSRALIFGILLPVVLGELGFILICVAICYRFFRRSWEIVYPGRKATQFHWEGQQYADFLACTVRFSQGPYNEVIQVLESQGKDDEARRVYRYMRGRELKEADQNWATLTLKWIFYVAAGSGVSVAPLCWFLGLYFAFTWLAVFSNPDSVEHPSTFQTAAEARDVTANPILVPVSSHPPAGDAYDHRTGRAIGTPWQFLGKEEDWPFETRESGHEIETHGEDAAKNKKTSEAQQSHLKPWDWQDGFWMAVKVHVPLIHIWAKEKWEPAAVQGYYYCPTPKEGYKDDDGHLIHPHMRPMWWGMEYETYAVIAQIVSYLTIPMLITAVGGFYKSQSQGSHHSHHAHHHGHAHNGHA